MVYKDDFSQHTHSIVVGTSLQVQYIPFFIFLRYLWKTTFLTKILFVKSENF